MPRMAREKTFESIFHIMSRSISEVDLFLNDEDRLEYLSRIKKYQKLYKFKVYGYCIMDNHAHLIIDANGADISKIMHSINFSYAQYFNRTHHRHGHLFQDRFKSKIVKTTRYLLALSAYIHNNPTVIPGFDEHPEKYEFSSLRVYLGISGDPYELIEDGFIMGLFGNDVREARKNYYAFVFNCDSRKFKEEVEFENEKTEYKSERKILVRDYKEEDIVDFVVSKMDIPKVKLYMKHERKLVKAKALIVILMRSLCNYKCSNICKVLGNITQARVSKLSSIGIDLIDKDERFRGIVEEFMICFAA